VPTIGIRFLYAFVILHHDRRRILSVAVTSHPTAEWVRGRSSKPFSGKRRRNTCSATTTVSLGSPHMSNASSRMPDALEASDEDLTVNHITISDQVAWSLSRRTCVGNLPSDPLRCRMRGDTER
jgi:hypothetical protein